MSIESVTSYGIRPTVDPTKRVPCECQGVWDEVVRDSRSGIPKERSGSVTKERV